MTDLERIGHVVIFRDARRAEVPAIVALLADDALGAAREGDISSAYWPLYGRVA